MTGDIIGGALGPARDPGRRFSPRGWAIGMLVTLLAQFGLGMYANLFIDIPSKHPGAGERDYLTATARGIAWLETAKDAPVVVATHVGVGLTLVVGSVWLVTLAIRARSRPTVSWSAVLGALCILGAAVNGGSFLDYNDDLNSYLMAMFFAAAVVCYSLILAMPPGNEPALGTLAAHANVPRAEPTSKVNGAGEA